MTRTQAKQGRPAIEADGDTRAAQIKKFQGSKMAQGQAKRAEIKQIEANRQEMSLIWGCERAKEPESDQ